jgi:hypothetical protein
MILYGIKLLLSAVAAMVHSIFFSLYGNCRDKIQALLQLKNTSYIKLMSIPGHALWAEMCLNYLVIKLVKPTSSNPCVCFYLLTTISK